MMNRRSFIKISGLGAIALAGGFGAGKLLNAEGNHFTIAGFLPAKGDVINDVISLFSSKVFEKTGINVNKYLDNRIIRNGNINQEYRYGFINISKLNKSIYSDILVSDEQISVYDPQNEFDRNYLALRNKLTGKKADLFLHISFKEEQLLNLKNENKQLEIYSENGLYDHISLNKSYKDITINGPRGKTSIALNNGSAHIHTATCRHELCRQMAARNKGDIIACAPNKILLKIS